MEVIRLCKDKQNVAFDPQTENTDGVFHIHYQILFKS